MLVWKGREQNIRAEEDELEVWRGVYVCSTDDFML